MTPGMMLEGRGMMRVAPVVAITLLVCVSGRVAAGEMQPPRITRAAVDWESAAQKLGEVPGLRAMHASADAGGLSREVDRLNAATAARLPGIDQSPVPVLLPFDLDAYFHDRVADQPADGPAADPSLDPADTYFAGFNRPAFFASGPAGYDATFRVSLATIPDLASIRFNEAADISISGSLLTYDLDPPVTDAGASVPALEADFPGIRRIMLENRVRYAFERFGVPYVVSVDCFDASFSRYHHMACRDADRVIERFLHALRIAGGMPQPLPAAAAAPAPERPAEVSAVFTYRPPGRLIPGTGYRQNGGRTDYTSYSNIRFPLAEAPAFANTQFYQRRVAGGVAAFPWRDNFCEGRWFAVAQCPGGMGHQGQDIGATECNRASAGDNHCPPHHDDVVAVRDGMIQRAPGQEAVYLVVNTPTEHIRFRYLHMRPKLLDAAGVLSGRTVAAGELLGQIGNYSQHENGTSYHVHFDIQVPTRAGWVYVSPYMTLVAAYERLIGGRGTEIDDMVAGATAGAISLAAVQRAFFAVAEPGEPAAHLARPRHLASACGARSWRHRGWRGCGVAQGAQGAQAAHATQAEPQVQGAQIVHHAPRALLAHRYYRRNRS
jgi:hypothetical protein